MSEMKKACLNGDVEACEILSNMNTSEAAIWWAGAFLAILVILEIVPRIVTMWRGY